VNNFGISRVKVRADTALARRTLPTTFPRTVFALYLRLHRAVILSFVPRVPPYDCDIRHLLAACYGPVLAPFLPRVTWFYRERWRTAATPLALPPPCLPMRLCLPLHVYYRHMDILGRPDVEG